MSGSSAIDTSDVILVRRAFQTKVAKHLPLFFAATTIIVPIIIFLLFLFDYQDIGNVWEKIKKASEKDTTILWRLLEFLITIVAITWLLYIQSKDKIIIGTVGITYSSPIPSWLPAIFTSWTMPWSRIKRAEIRKLLGIGQPTLVLNNGTTDRKILIDAWGKRDEKPKLQEIKDLFRLQKNQYSGSAEEMQSRLEASPLIQALRVRNIPVVYPQTSDAGLTFDLQSHPRTKIAVAVFLGLIIYAAVDTFFLDETYVENFQWATWIVAGVFAGLLAQRWLSGPKIPVFVSIGLAVMIGLGVAVALYPGLLRLNQFTDTAGLRPHAYILHVYAELTPVEGGLPIVRFNQYKEYWQQFPLGSEHRLYLRQGSLGFYQLDQAPLAEAMRQYYRDRNTAKPASSRR